jgi:hypothetical protein
VFRRQAFDERGWGQWRKGLVVDVVVVVRFIVEGNRLGYGRYVERCRVVDGHWVRSCMNQGCVVRFWCNYWHVVRLWCDYWHVVRLWCDGQWCVVRF